MTVADAVMVAMVIMGVEMVVMAVVRTVVHLKPRIDMDGITNADESLKIRLFYRGGFFGSIHEESTIYVSFTGTVSFLPVIATITACCSAKCLSNQYIL